MRARRGAGPSIEVLFLRRIEYWSHLLFWSKTKAGEAGRDAPVLVPLPGDSKRPGRDSLGLDEKLARRAARRQAELRGVPVSIEEDQWPAAQ